MGDAFAGTLTNTSIIELGGASNVSPMIEGDPQSFAIEFTAANTTGTSPTITITFTGWTGGAAGIIGASVSQTVADNSCTTLFPGTPTGIVAHLTGVTVASTPGSGLITLSSTGGTLTAGVTYCTELTYTSAVTNPTATGDYNVVVNDSTDSQTIAIDVLSSGANAYSITATVNPTFTMSEGASTDTFPGALSSSAVTVSAGITWTINTNAKSGWFVWAADATAGLHSTTASKTIASVVEPGAGNYAFASNTGAENYGLGVSADYTTNYQYLTSNHGGGLTTVATGFQEIATAGVPANNVQFVTHELANISPTTPPATDYTDTITLIGSGSF